MLGESGFCLPFHFFSLFLISLPREPEADLCKCFPEIFSLKTNCVYTVGISYVAYWLGVHKCIVTNTRKKKATNPTPSILVWFLPYPWTLRNVLCSVLHTVNSWSRDSTIVWDCFSNFSCFYFHFICCSPEATFPQKSICPGIGNLSLNQVLVSAGWFIIHSQTFVLFLQMEATNEMKTVKLTNTSHQSAD